MANSKIIFGGNVLIDLTGDTITADQVAKGATAHDKTGSPITGTSTKDVDSGDATAAEAELLTGKTAYARGAKITGTMPNNGAVSGEVAAKEQAYTIPQGYHDGSGKVSIAAAEKSKLVPANIRQGVTILGVAGSMTGSEGVKAQAKTITSSTKLQTVNPDDGFTHLSQVVVQPIPYAESPNSAGGTTVTIG